MYVWHKYDAAMLHEEPVHKITDILIRQFMNMKILHYVFLDMSVDFKLKE